ncbi:autotransporter-associated beta strand repeat-containing protein [Bilophila wadsworthia]|uniref:autotransporter-associated beta strand repeat-containing protein n=1 Tax=Bilophila wadsworthia TaxID=35833 RepID=UPI003A85448F
MKTLPSRPPVLFHLCATLCLCGVMALALAFPAPPAQAAELNIYGGGGGVNATGGNGGNGGSAGAGLGYAGGDGDASGKGGKGTENGTDVDGGTGGGVGGNGGAASLTLSGDDLSFDTLNIRGGAVGELGSGNTGGAGGSGGDASVFAKNLTVKTLSMHGGDSTGGGKGGDANFTAGTLKTGNIVLHAHDGNLAFRLKKLVWTGSDTFYVSPDGTTIEIGSLTIDGGTVNKDTYGNLISADSFYTGTKDITLGTGGAPFDTTDGAQSVDRNLIGSGALTKDGTNTLTLTGNNTYTGDTTIKAGILTGNIADNTKFEHRHRRGL